MKIIMCLILMFVVTGCATVNRAVDTNYSLSSKGGTGLLIASVKYRGPVSGYKVYYKSVDENTNGSLEAGAGVMLIPILPKSDFSTVNGKLEVQELPAGEYEINSWRVVGGYVNVVPATPFSIKFKIEPGKATYIGSFIFDVKYTMGLSVIGVKLTHKDSYLEDTNVLFVKYPNLNESNINMGLEVNSITENLGAGNSTSIDIPPVISP
ncbi:hypothetical protein QFX18_03515 [Saccharophagus degradans]|uniref:hypothetical protein n=1 Tax=Saccharophagus degradans TaxID=86304 RepID=UPI0024780F9C|nr:hypothetical protein [Saccharophagus degradans]WGO99128.1 hypothetical protein QFX18_03515 [Saccharophagus degradans]